MSPTPSTRNPAPAPATERGRRRIAAAATAAVLLALTGCAQLEDANARLARQVHEIGCISRCQTVKDQCDDAARFDYQQCEAGYEVAQRDFRWCNESSAERCGYPWWSCSENLYGYCTNRFRECSDACRRAGHWGTAARQPRPPAAKARY